VVEINPKVIALRSDFQVPADGERFRVVEADGAQFMRDTERRYDVVLLDAFGPQGLPRALSSQRFYDDCVDALHPGGLLVSNFHSAAGDFDACVQRIEHSFDRRALVVTDGDARNSIVFARKGGALTAPARASTGRPKGLDDAAWTQLHEALERIATVLAGRPQAGAAGGS
jgi:spermidine synthase